MPNRISYWTKSEKADRFPIQWVDYRPLPATIYSNLGFHSNEPQQLHQHFLIQPQWNRIRQYLKWSKRKMILAKGSAKSCSITLFQCDFSIISRPHLRWRNGALSEHNGLNKCCKQLIRCTDTCDRTLMRNTRICKASHFQSFVTPSRNQKKNWIFSHWIRFIYKKSSMKSELYFLDFLQLFVDLINKCGAVSIKNNFLNKYICSLIRPHGGGSLEWRDTC